MSDFSNIIEEINENLPDNTTQAITAKKLRDTLIDLTTEIDTETNSFESEIRDILDDFVVNNLNSDDTTKALSAAQGKELKNRVNYIALTGNGDIYDTNQIYCFSGHKYRIYPNKTDVDFNGISYETAGYFLLSIRNTDESSNNSITLFERGCNDKVSPLNYFYDVTAHQNGFLNIFMRAAEGESIKFFVIDITDTNELYNSIVGLQIQQNQTIESTSTIVESGIIPSYIENSRAQYQRVGRNINDCVVSSSSFSLQKYEVSANTTYIFGGIYPNVSSFIYPICWTDENNVIVKVENLRTKGDETVVFTNENITSPYNAKYLYINYLSQFSSYFYLKKYSQISSSELQDNLESAISEIEKIDDVLEPNIIYEVGQNKFNKDNLLYGYLISSGQLIDSTNGVLSNPIYLIPNKDYTIQGIVAYGSPSRVYVGFFDKDDNFLGRFGIDNSSYSTKTFNFKNLANGTFELVIPANYAYCRFQVKNSATEQNFSIIQIEEGDVAHEVEPYTETATLDINNVVKYTEQLLTAEEKEIARNNIDSPSKKQIRILSIGNSYSQDTLSYVPWLLKNIAKDIDITIGICMLSSSYLSQHYGNFETDYAAYTFQITKNCAPWQTISGKKSIKWALDNYVWDIVILQQSSTYSYQSYDLYYEPYLNQLINSISNYIDYPVKFGWLLTQSRPAETNGGANWDDTTIISHYNSIASNSQKVYNESICDFVIPAGTAIQNARTIESIKALGAYSTNTANTSNYGYLCYSDGTHLQDGLGCHISALATICKILELSGYDYYSVVGDGTLVTSAFLTSINIIGQHGSPIGENANNVRIGAMCAVMACKNPYEITDMNDYVALTKCVVIKNYSHIENNALPYPVTYNSSFSITLSASTGYNITEVNVKMGDDDITSEVYNSSTHKINIEHVTNCVLIKAIASS